MTSAGLNRGDWQRSQKVTYRAEKRIKSTQWRVSSNLFGWTRSNSLPAAREEILAGEKRANALENISWRERHIPLGILDVYEYTLYARPVELTNRFPLKKEATQPATNEATPDNGEKER